MTAAMLALWNDYPAEHAEEYAFWHTFEHVPERLTVPGMRAARRYVSASQPETYFTLYELENLSVIEHPAYFDLVRNPTPWSLKMRRHFSRVLRIPGQVVATGGNGIGGAANVQVHAIARNKAETAIDALETDLAHLMKQGRIIGFKVALAEPNQSYEVFVQDEATDPDTVNVLIIAEAACVQSLKPVQNKVNNDIPATLGPRKTLRNDIFTMLVSYRGDEFPKDRSQIGMTRAHSPLPHFSGE